VMIDAQLLLCSGMPEQDARKPQELNKLEHLEHHKEEAYEYAYRSLKDFMETDKSCLFVSSIVQIFMNFQAYSQEMEVLLNELKEPVNTCFTEKKQQMKNFSVSTTDQSSLSTGSLKKSSDSNSKPLPTPNNSKTQGDKQSGTLYNYQGEVMMSAQQLIEQHQDEIKEIQAKRQRQAQQLEQSQQPEVSPREANVSLSTTDDISSNHSMSNTLSANNSRNPIKDKRPTVLGTTTTTVGATTISIQSATASSTTGTSSASSTITKPLPSPRKAQPPPPPQRHPPSQPQLSTTTTTTATTTTAAATTTTAATTIAATTTTTTATTTESSMSPRSNNNLLPPPSDDSSIPLTTAAIKASFAANPVIFKLKPMGHQTSSRQQLLTSTTTDISSVESSSSTSGMPPSNIAPNKQIQATSSTTVTPTSSSNLKKEQPLKNRTATFSTSNNSISTSAGNDTSTTLSSSVSQPSVKPSSVQNIFKPNNQQEQQSSNKQEQQQQPSNKQEQQQMKSSAVAIYPFTASEPKELSLQVGDEVEILERFDDGWILGREISPDAIGRQGLFPKSYVEDVVITKALYDFVGETEDDLSLKKGEEVKILKRFDDGWHYGRSLQSGNVGLFPGNFTAAWNNKG